MDFILGSQSPRRKEILNFFFLPFRCVSSDFDENSIPFEGDPEYYVQILSKSKCETLAPHFPSSLILTADTTVYLDHKIYNKPQDEEEAYRYLKELSGKGHSVFTGLTLHCKGKLFHTFEETKVYFNALTEKQIQSYIEALSYKDKAGGYMIQGAGSLIVNRIEGCYYNVMGLPINALTKLLLNAEIDLWKHLASV